MTSIGQTARRRWSSGILAVLTLLAITACHATLVSPPAGSGPPNIAFIRMIATVRATLTAAGVAADTHLVFSSDNGHHMEE